MIAAINGHAIGLGLTLALQCDIRIFAADAQYGVVQVRRGVVGDAYSHWVLPRLVGHRECGRDPADRRHVRRPPGRRARVGQPGARRDEVLPAALELARDIAVNTAPVSVAASKRLLWDSFDLDRAGVGAPGDRDPPGSDGPRRRQGRRAGVHGTAGAELDGETRRPHGSRAVPVKRPPRRRHASARPPSRSLPVPHLRSNPAGRGW